MPSATSKQNIPKTPQNSGVSSEHSSQDSSPQRSGRTTFGVSLLGACLLWLSFPPVGWWPLGWIATAPFVWLIASDRLDGKRPYRIIWTTSFAYWLATFYFIPIPHWALWGGWILVSFYMAFYVPLFVAISRVAVHRFNLPTVIAAPIAWVGIEWIRCWAFTGMPMVCLSHTQYQQPILIQIADLFGAYTLTFSMVLFAAASYRYLLWAMPPRVRPGWSGLCISICVLGVVLGYGYLRLEQRPTGNDSKTLVVGLIQGSIDTEFPSSDEELQKYKERRHNQYSELTLQAQTKWEDLDLIVWPESTFPIPDLLPDTDTSDFSFEDAAYYRDYPTRIWGSVTGRPFKRAVPLLSGGVSTDFAGTVYNSAIFLDDTGRITQRYHKNHRVMFGEYVPFAEWFPVLQNLFPPGMGIQAGTEPIVIPINDVKIAPSICFESTVPHFIRRQINELAADGTEPDVMVNVTNDGWFFGTSCLDLHLACNVFRAVEMRKTHLVCANTGFSAHIDPNGQIFQQGPRRETAILRAEVQPTSGGSLYRWVGDIPVGILGICSVLVGLIGWLKKPSRMQSR